MKILYRIKLLSLLMILSSVAAYAQVSITGTVTDEAGEPLVGVNIALQGKVIGTISDWDGNFELTTSSGLPATLEISIIGFETQAVTVNSESELPLAVTMVEQVYITDEVVVSASRFEQSILKSPVTIEKMDILDIKTAASEDFYSALINLKGIDINTQSFGFKNLSLRSFNESGNTRVVQLIDGMDNQAPGLNFPVGNLFGIQELDLESVEVLPGASSALYGPNAITGIVLLTSKSPFEYQGLSAQVKVGLNHLDGEDTDTSPYSELGIRYAKALSDKFAFKVNAHFLTADDWRASNLDDQTLPGGTRATNTGYNGVNIYGDEVVAGLPLNAADPTELTQVSRDGFTEEQISPLDVENVKLNAALHFRPNEDIELILHGNYGTASTMYTGADRYYLDGFTFQQYKLEAKADNWFVRGYTTIEDAGDSYALTTAAGIANNSFVSNEDWFNAYVGAHFAAQAQGLSGMQADAAARAAANTGIPTPGTPAFDNAFNQIATTSALQGGALLEDNTKLYSFEGMYDFKNEIDFVSLIVGANWRTYDLQSNGSVFALDDNGEEFSITEWGAYMQLNKKVANDKLDLTGSVRYDKNENFDGRFTPRLSAVLTVAEDHNIRVSYQTGFKMPTTQFQYLDLAASGARVLGGLPFLRERYNFDTNPVYQVPTFNEWIGTFLSQGPAAAQPILDNGAVEFGEFELETSETWEIGYKALIDNRFLIDAYYFNSRFNNFALPIVVLQSSTTPNDPAGLFAPNVFLAVVNAPVTLETDGWAFGFNYVLGKGYNLGGNVAYNKLNNRDELEEGFLSGFNTPEYKFNLVFSNREIVDNLGFKVAYRWQDEFLWESPFVTGIVPSFGTVDLQLSYRLENLKTIAKLGSSNLFNNRYVNSYGNPTIGQVVYLSLTYDQFFN